MIDYSTKRPTVVRVVYVEGIMSKDLNAIFEEMIDIAKTEHVLVRANDINTHAAYANEWDTLDDVRRRWEKDIK